MHAGEAEDAFLNSHGMKCCSLHSGSCSFSLGSLLELREEEDVQRKCILQYNLLDYFSIIVSSIYKKIQH